MTVAVNTEPSNIANEYVTGRVQRLTAREWVYEYDHGKVWPSAWGPPREGYIAVSDDFDPMFIDVKKPKAKPRVSFRL